MLEIGLDRRAGEQLDDLGSNRCVALDVRRSLTLHEQRSRLGEELTRLRAGVCEAKAPAFRLALSDAGQIAVPAAGAYSRSMASNYNHVPRPPVVAVRDGHLSTLLRRETMDDLLALDPGA